MINNNKTLIIGEAGVNHNGSIDLACKLIEVAAKAGVDVVKFQTFIAEECISYAAPKANYQLASTNNQESQFEMAKKLELNEENHKILIDKCNNCGIEFMSSAFDIKSINLLNSLSVKRFKIPSGEITNLPYLRHIGKIGKPIILSTGMASMSEIKTALDIIEKSGTERSKIVVLHCNTEYPTLMSDVNLRAMITIKKELNVKVGYSDHTLGVEIPIAAVTMGAQVIEKHFTLDNSLIGPDHKASLEPDQLMIMVQSIRNVEKSLGSEIKNPSYSEIKNLKIVRKSIVARKIIKKGEKFTEDNLAVKRPSIGISPMYWDNVINKEADRDYQPDDLIIIK